MTDELTLILEIAPPVPFTCANATGIEKGAILKMTDPRTASLADGDTDIVAGIAASEKIASDGNTTVPIYRQGWFKVKASGNTTAGDALITAASTGGTNQVATAAVNSENIIGIALETATVGETFLMELKNVVMNLA